MAGKEAKALNHSYVGTEHILLGLLREGDGVAARVLKNLDVDIERTRNEILKELDPNFSPNELGVEDEDGIFEEAEVSGGKDSFFQAHLIKELGYNALLVCLLYTSDAADE